MAFNLKETHLPERSKEFSCFTPGIYFLYWALTPHGLVVCNALWSKCIRGSVAMDHDWHTLPLEHFKMWKLSCSSFCAVVKSLDPGWCQLAVRSVTLRHGVKCGKVFETTVLFYPRAIPLADNSQRAAVGSFRRSDRFMMFNCSCRSEMRTSVRGCWNNAGCWNCLFELPSVLHRPHFYKSMEYSFFVKRPFHSEKNDHTSSSCNKTVSGTSVCTMAFIALQ